MNLARRSLPNLGSGRISRLAITLLLGMTSPLAKSLSGKPGTSVRKLSALPHPAFTLAARTARPYSYQTEISLLGDEIDQDFGRLVPYLERACLRFCTPEVSRAPRTV